jgi:hypothetical protein
MLVQVKEAISGNSVKKELFNDIQNHLSNKLKRDAFDIKFWSSDNFSNYLNSLITMELALLRDFHENESKEFRIIFDLVCHRALFLTF